MVSTNAGKNIRRNRKIPPLPDLRANERLFVDLHASLEGKVFESDEEANAAIQKILADCGGRPRPAKKITPLEKAQDIMYDAWDAAGKDRIELAREALAISKDCADAWVLLAEEEANDAAEALNFFENGMRAGERALGAEAFEEDAGDFWMILETRPYMRARFGVAQVLHSQGERSRAIEHFSELLRLNPNDNQGARYELAICLLEEGDDEALERLLTTYAEDGSAVWFYSRALLAFRQEGRSLSADTCLTRAFEQNRFVPQYMIGKKIFPRHPPEYISRGDRSEAIAYTIDAAKAWLETPGALEWMNTVYKTFRRGRE